MPAAPRVLTGNLTDINAAAAAGVVITFERGGVASQYGDVVLPNPTSVVTNASGAFSVTLYPGTYSAFARTQSGPARFNFSLAEDGSTDLAALLEEVDIPVTAQIVLDTQAARDEAIAAVATVPLSQEDFSTVAALLADTTLTYTTGQPKSVTVGQIVPAGGFRYEVAASTASDHHVTTAGGVKLYVLPGADGYLPFAAWGPTLDGSTDNSALVTSAIANGPVIFSGDGECRISANTTLAKPCKVENGFVFSIDSGATLTVTHELTAGNYEIFDGDGTVNCDNSSTGYNLSWFKTANGYINERFDFAKRGMTSFRSKTISIPLPYQGQSGVLASGGRLFWQFSAPLTFTDDQNASIINVDGEFLAANDCAGFLVFDDTTKPENIYFFGRIQAQATAAQTVDVGIDIKAADRVQFFCNVLLNGFQTSLKVGGPSMTASVNNCYFPFVTASFFYENAVLIHGQSASLTNQGNTFGRIIAIAAQTTGLSAVKISGLVRDLQIDSVNYGTDTPKNGYAAENAQNVVEIDGSVSGVLMSHVDIQSIYQSTGEVALKIGSSVPATGLVRDINVDKIFGKFNATAVDVDYCSLVKIGDVENSSDVVIGSNASFVQVNSNAGIRAITDGGASTLINGLGKQSRGAFTAPAPATAWPIGSLIRETGDDRVYLRIASAGTDSDFLMMRGRAIRSVTASRPTLGVNDAGYLYFDTTLDADGKPIWWTGVAWVDATGATV